MIDVTVHRDLELREERALDLYRTRGEQVNAWGSDIYTVPSADGERLYTVDYRMETCTCPDYVHRGASLGRPCKHIMVVGILRARVRKPRRRRMAPAEASRRVPSS